MTEIITTDRRMRELINLARTVAQNKATVLIQGESGTGKELVATLVHENSPRASRPFVAINCAAIPENLLESELFGYERGAFTGAVNSKAGKFEFANGGTLLLDEVSEMDIRLQAKLLRVLQEGEVDRIGGRRPTPVDVRIIATCNRNLADCVREGFFRQDLFYRLNVINLSVPALRERTGDVTLLSEAFMRTFCQASSQAPLTFAPEALGLLETHGWPGNVRELENVIERAVITARDGVIQAADIVIERVRLQAPLASQAALAALTLIEAGLSQATRVIEGEPLPSDVPAVVNAASGAAAQLVTAPWLPGQTLDLIERKVILDALEYHRGNRTHTAKALGISIRTLRNKLADYRRIGIHV